VITYAAAAYARTERLPPRSITSSCRTLSLPSSPYNTTPSPPPRQQRTLRLPPRALLTLSPLFNGNKRQYRYAAPPLPGIFIPRFYCGRTRFAAYFAVAFAAPVTYAHRAQVRVLCETAVAALISWIVGSAYTRRTADTPPLPTNARNMTSALVS